MDISQNVKQIKDDVFIQPTVITVKKDRSVKIALDARALNAAIKKDKYPMPNLDNLIDQVAEILNSGTGETWFTTLDLQYAYGQIPLHPDTSKTLQLSDYRGSSYGYLLFPNRLLRADNNAYRISKDNGFCVFSS